LLEKYQAAITIMLFTVCGNLLVIISVIRERKLRQRISNYLILSLAVTDLLGVYAIPIRPVVLIMLKLHVF
jgi:hypothetical protein